MVRTQSGGGVILNARGEVALVMNGRESDWWGFPKGHVDEGESPLEAARREIEEETGLSDLELVKPLGSYTRFKGAPGGGEDHSELKTIHMFLFRTTQERLASRDPQNPEARWFPLSEVTKRLTHAKDREFFDSVLAMLVPAAGNDPAT